MWLGLWLLLGGHLASTISSYICEPPFQPVITAPAASSQITANSLTVAGTATAGSQVHIDEDGQEVLLLTADNQNYFSGTIAVRSGSHTLTPASTSPCGNGQGNPVTFQVLSPPRIISTPAPYASKLPTAPATPVASSISPLTISLTNPTHTITTKADSIIITGTTNLPSKISITASGELLAASEVESTTFSLRVPLLVGANHLVVTASADNQTASASVEVNRLAEQPSSGSAAVSSPWYDSVQAQIALAVMICLTVLGGWFIIRRRRRTHP